MVEQQARGTRYIRAFGLFALLAGIVAMHAVVFGMPMAESGHTGHSQHSQPAHESVLAAAVPESGMNAMSGCGGDCDGGHAGMHGCLFVLSALLLGLGLALLGWAALRDRETTTARARRPRAHHARPPPWTVLTLADLAILRI